MNRLFIVQERYKGGPWLDDPDQPDNYMHDYVRAKHWMDRDNYECHGHTMTYEHRIIERTETQVWPNSAIPGADTSTLPDRSLSRKTFPVDWFSSVIDRFSSDQPHGV
jgi:hypothetical protein